MSYELFLMFLLYTTIFGLATYNTEITGYQDLGKLLMVGDLEIKQYVSTICLSKNTMIICRMST